MLRIDGYPVKFPAQHLELCTQSLCGRDIDRLVSLTGTTAITAARAVLTALQHLGVKKLALGTPYPEAISAKGKDYWEEAGFDIVGYHRLADV